MSRLYLELSELKPLYTPHLLFKQIILTEISLMVCSFVFLINKKYVYDGYEKDADANKQILLPLFLELEDRYINPVVSYRIGYLSEDDNSGYYTNAYIMLIDRELSGIESFYLGAMYYYGKGTIMDKEQGLKYYHQAADQKFIKAFTNIGTHYRDRKNNELAVSYYEKGTALNDHYSMANLGYMLEVGKGIKQDIPRAHELYQKAAHLGNNWAINRCKELLIHF